MSSQHEEDFIISKYFDGYVGSYLDIGAGEPILFSNTYSLYQQGWHGLVVEPYFDYVKMWEDVRPKDALLQVAITDYDGKATMATTAIVGSWVGDEYKERGDKTYEVDCYTIMTLLDKYPDTKTAEFVSIDVESNERKILSKWDFGIFKPKIICIERQLRGIDRRENWQEFLLPHYKVDKETSTNAFYVKR